MKTTKRFDNAVMKLYNAFHGNRLNAMDCKACAVGNLCNNNSEWVDYMHINGLDFRMINRDSKIYKFVKNDEKNILKTGYSALELAQVENIFMFGYKLQEKNPEDYIFTTIGKEKQFDGLCRVIEYLSELDNIPNPMDYTKLFETENNKPKYQLV